MGQIVLFGVLGASSCQPSDPPHLPSRPGRSSRRGTQASAAPGDGPRTYNTFQPQTAHVRVNLCDQVLLGGRLGSSPFPLLQTPLRLVTSGDGVLYVCWCVDSGFPRRRGGKCFPGFAPSGGCARTPLCSRPLSAAAPGSWSSIPRWPV